MSKDEYINIMKNASLIRQNESIIINLKQCKNKSLIVLDEKNKIRETF